jgi:predicted nucleic acid-binding protein
MSADSCVFVDSNVFLYAIDGTNPGKQRAARAWVDRLWASGSGRCSWQVLNEFYVNAIRKMGATKPAARSFVEALAQWDPAGYGLGIVNRAWHWTDAAQINYWDALIVASAEALGCRWLLSEDFQTDRKFGNVTVLDPFGKSPESIIPFLLPPPNRR